MISLKNRCNSQVTRILWYDTGMFLTAATTLLVKWSCVQAAIQKLKRQ